MSNNEIMNRTLKRKFFLVFDDYNDFDGLFYYYY